METLQNHNLCCHFHFIWFLSPPWSNKPGPKAWFILSTLHDTLLYANVTGNVLRMRRDHWPLTGDTLGAGLGVVTAHCHRVAGHGAGCGDGGGWGGVLWLRPALVTPCLPRPSPALDTRHWPAAPAPPCYHRHQSRGYSPTLLSYRYSYLCYCHTVIARC